MLLKESKPQKFKFFYVVKCLNIRLKKSTVECFAPRNLMFFVKYEMFFERTLQ